MAALQHLWHIEVSRVGRAVLQRSFENISLNSKTHIRARVDILNFYSQEDILLETQHHSAIKLGIEAWRLNQKPCYMHVQTGIHAKGTSKKETTILETCACMSTEAKHHNVPEQSCIVKVSGLELEKDGRDVTTDLFDTVRRTGRFAHNFMPGILDGTTASVTSSPQPYPAETLFEPLHLNLKAFLP